MINRHGKLRLLSLGAGLAVIAAAGFFVSGPVGLAQGDKATKGSASTEGKGCCSSAKSGDKCCSGEKAKCCCARKAQGEDGLESVALAQDGQDKQEPKEKEKMMMASPEAKAKGTAARKAVEEHRKALAKEMVYGCCIKPGCNFCSLAGDMCPCAMNLRKGGPVCPECWGGWQVGFGRLEGVDAAKVQVIPKSKLKMMYEMKTMSFQKAIGN